MIALQYFLPLKTIQNCIYVRLPNGRGNIQSHGHSLVQIGCATKVWKYATIPF